MLQQQQQQPGRSVERPRFAGFASHHQAAVCWEILQQHFPPSLCGPPPLNPDHLPGRDIWGCRLDQCVSRPSAEAAGQG
ncbi:hypothetical protein E2C01_039754 [Portunus trituberculatus]|uniref:Uncharacterized protein n=1 Tax=Portunus trituberculatus TaxID=210409 RepID=A0A5B7FKU8_PORTR|nr:hypothetical protein [Portunus trituberculatus]